jgi:signal peptidase I
MQRFSSALLDIIQVLFFAISIFLFVYLLVLQPHKIRGDSMLPNFHEGEFLLTDKLSYRFGTPSRGDVIVFKAPPDDKEEFIKRIIGTPGDRVMVKEGRVWVNGSPLNEPYLDSSVQTLPQNFAQEGVELVVPQNQYFVMGDNRMHSYDSRNLGFIDKSKFIGKAWILYWPPKDAGIVAHVNY